MDFTSMVEISDDNSSKELGMYRFDKEYRGLYKHDIDDAGYDIYVEEDTWLWIGTVKKLKANVAIQLPSDKPCFGLVTSRSGLSLKGVFVIPGIIDIGYKGQISCITAHLNFFPRRIKKGTRIGQLLIVPLVRTHLTEYYRLNDFTKTNRGDKGFGSSGI